MYETLIAKIQATLDQVATVKEAFSVPNTKLIKYPSVFFKPVSFEQSFETRNENSTVYRFIMVVMVGTNSNLTPAEAFNTILPKTIDDILAQFDQDWDQGTIDGHRVRMKIESADPWEMSEEEDGLVAYAPMTIEFRLLTSN